MLPPPPWVSLRQSRQKHWLYVLSVILIVWGPLYCRDVPVIKTPNNCFRRLQIVTLRVTIRRCYSNYWQASQNEQKAFDHLENLRIECVSPPSSVAVRKDWFSVIMKFDCWTVAKKVAVSSTVLVTIKYSLEIWRRGSKQQKKGAVLFKAGSWFANRRCR